MRALSSFLLFFILIACSQGQVSRLPSSSSIYIGKAQLEHMKPTEVIQLLKDNDEKTSRIFFERSDVSFWGKKEIDELEKMLGDKTEISPVVRKTSGVICFGKKYRSTVDREVRHLIKAIKKGQYPLAQCSTYDLKFD